MRHGNAAIAQEIVAGLRGDRLVFRPKVPDDPRLQVALGLIAEFHLHGVFLHHIPELFHAFVRLELGRAVGQHQTAVVREVGERFRNFVPLRLRQKEEVDVVHLHQ